LGDWNQILYEFSQLNLNDSSDKVGWSLGKSDVFSTRSVYQLLEKNVAGPHNKWIWKAGIPLKIKVFMWQAFQDAVITRDNMRKRKWPGSPLCSFCGAVETTNHLFFHFFYFFFLTRDCRAKAPQQFI
jgi:hypothetical protein